MKRRVPAGDNAWRFDDRAIDDYSHRADSHDLVKPRMRNRLRPRFSPRPVWTQCWPMPWRAEMSRASWQWLRTVAASSTRERSE